MMFWICLGIFAAAVLLVFLYSALVIASRDDDLTDEYYQKHLEEEME